MAASTPIAETAGTKLAGMAMLSTLVPESFLSHPFIAALAQDLKRLELSAELLSMPLDIWSPMGTEGTVV